MSDYILVYVIFENKQQAELIGVNLVESGLIACINILPPITSIYRWDNKVQKSSETAAFLKTTKEKYPQVENKIMSLHSYNKPCIVAMELVLGNSSFLDWIKEQVK